MTIPTTVGMRVTNLLNLGRKGRKNGRKGGECYRLNFFRQTTAPNPIASSENVAGSGVTVMSKA